MFYWLVKTLLYIAFRAYFAKIKANFWTSIPKNKPIVLACNHQSAFLDAIIVGYFLDRPVHFLTRGDVFNAKWKRKVFSAFNMIPIYRRRDDENFMQKNESTFEICYQYLAQNKIILIFPEGDCFSPKRLRQYKKGMARIVFGAAQRYQFNLDTQIVPVGINYSNSVMPFGNVILNFGKPIAAQNYYDLYKENDLQAINKLTDDVRNGHLKTMLHVPHHKFDHLVEIIDAATNQHWQKDLNKAFVHFNTIAKKLDTMHLNTPDTYEKLAQQINHWSHTLKRYQLKPSVFFVKPTGFKSMMIDFFTLLLLLPLGLLSIIINFLPSYLSYQVAHKKIKDVVFRASITLVLSMFLLIFVHLALAYVVGLNYGFVVGILSLLLFAGTAWLMSYYLRLLQNFVIKYRYYNFKKKHNMGYQNLYKEFLDWSQKII